MEANEYTLNSLDHTDPTVSKEISKNYPSFIANQSPHHQFSHTLHPHHEDSKKVMEHAIAPHLQYYGKVEVYPDPPTDYTQGKIITGIPTVPVTQKRRPYVPERHEHGHGKGLEYAGVPRANMAASVENPYGTSKENYAVNHHHETVLQQHCAFFDRDKDGVIWPHDTYIGFRRIGFNILISLFATFIIHVNFSYPSSHSIIPDPFFRIWLDNIHKCKHGSDTNTYDSEGRFTPQHFEDFFEKFSSVSPQNPAVGKKGEANSAAGDGGPNQHPKTEATKKGITYYDILRGWNSQRRVMDPIGWSAEFLEWSATYLLLWPEDGIMRKEDIRRVYDGSIFWELAEKEEKSRMLKEGLPPGKKSGRMIQLNKEKDAEFSRGKKRVPGGYLGDMGRQQVISEKMLCPREGSTLAIVK